MSSHRTMVDRLDAGDGLTYALVALAGLGSDVKSVAADPKPFLRVVEPDEVPTPSDPLTDRYDMVLAGLVALGDLVRSLAVAGESPAAAPIAKTASLLPRDLLR